MNVYERIRESITSWAEESKIDIASADQDVLAAEIFDALEDDDDDDLYDDDPWEP